MSLVFDLGTLGAEPADGVRAVGQNDLDQFGFSVSAGDFNGDGIGDFFVGAPRNDKGGSNAGAAYLLFGGKGSASLDMDAIPAGAGFKIIGADPADRAGFSVSAASDVNGDGYDDLIIGAPFREGDIGGAYVIFGRAGAPSTIDLGRLQPSDGFVIRGETFNFQAGRIGYSVAGGGDINNDGFDDIVIGSEALGSYVIFGKAGAFGIVQPLPTEQDGTYRVLELAALTAPDGFKLRGDFEQPGISSSFAGDVNGDGIDDLVLGASNARSGGYAGGAYVIFGKAGSFSDINVSTMGAETGFLLAASDGLSLGTSVSAADVNGDGYSDIIVGDPSDEGSSEGFGATYVVYGSANPRSVSTTQLTSDLGYKITGPANAGSSVAGIDDINGDGIDDILIGAPSFILDSKPKTTGDAYVVYGKSGARSTVNLADWLPSDGYRLAGAAVGDLTGQSVASGDFNSDGLADLLIGAPSGPGFNFFDPFNGGPGKAYAVQGAATEESVTWLGTAIGQTMRGGAADDFLTGRGGNDMLFGSGGNDQMLGDEGDDVLDGGPGADVLSGGAGNDSYRVDSAADIIFEAAGYGSDEVVAAASYSLTEGASIETLKLSNPLATSGYSLRGNAAAQALTGNAGENILDGGGGADVMNGLGGNDTYFVDDYADRVIDTATSGSIDTVKASVSYGLGAGVRVETLRTTSDSSKAAINLAGNEFANALVGNAGANTLNGRGGADAMNGLGGNDTYIIDNRADRVIETATSGSIDTVKASVSYALATGARVETLRTTSDAGTGAISLAGNEFSQTLIGNRGANTLKGNAGNDVVKGGAGNDRIFGGTGRDILYGEAGSDRFYFDSSLTSANRDAIEDFSSRDDSLLLKKGIFSIATVGTVTASTPSAIKADAFKRIDRYDAANPTARAVDPDSSDRIIYDQAGGNIYYDADGSGVKSAVLFATVDPGTALSAADFLIFI